MSGDLTDNEIDHVLKHQLLGHIGCHAKNVTYIVPICYAYESNCIYGRTFEGMKINMMRENPMVCFQAEYLESMVKWKSVVCWGEFEELTEPAQRNKGIEILYNRISGAIEDKHLQTSRYWPFSLNESDNIAGIIFRVHVHKKTGKFENSSRRN